MSGLRPIFTVNLKLARLRFVVGPVTTGTDDKEGCAAMAALFYGWLAI